MPDEDQAKGHPDENQRWFATTHWSVVLSARADSSQAAAALESLCRAYWPPLYTYARRRGRDVHQAQDLTQQFIAHLLATDFLANVTPAKGKFRSFLLASFNHFLANEHARASALKRGGGVSLVPLEPGDTEDWLRCEPAGGEPPDVIFERRWALTLLERAFDGLRQEFERARKAAQFDRLKSFLEGEVKHGDYDVAARELGMTASAVAVAVHRMRHRYRELLRREVADTVESPAEIEEELKHLIRVLSG